MNSRVKLVRTLALAVVAAAVVWRTVQAELHLRDWTRIVNLSVAQPTAEK